LGEAFEYQLFFLRKGFYPVSTDGFKTAVELLL